MPPASAHSDQCRTGRARRSPARAGSYFVVLAHSIAIKNIRIVTAVGEGKTVKNRLHLDISASEGRSVSLDTRREQVDAEVERLVALGARVNRVSQEPGLDHYAVTLYDPEGNEFCVY